MISIFGKPIEELTRGDVTKLISDETAEGEGLEFKRGLSGGGGSDAGSFRPFG